ncbi:MAG: hypothetical protein CVT94_15675 [Bacteroidetes bacterium HGW-Bacteroidetes-11]|jgi:hypothetical protein|nr:MAG: hypothetical protein CVT94_15675 [Bacteroidetes bacterium HGW-Bacteroidetes-11]
MKSFKIIMSVLALAVVMASCTKEQQNDSSQPVDKGITKATVNGLNYVKLFAGQTIYVGTASFEEKTIDGVRYLEVCYEIEEPWLMTQFHFDIKDIPVNKQGSPMIGNFDHSASFNPGVEEHCFMINLDEEGLECDGTYEAAAHAVVVKDDGNGGVISQTAWGEGDLFRGKGSWAMKFNITMDDCLPPPDNFCYQKETAFGGESAGSGNAWWFYFDPNLGTPQSIFAGQTIYVGSIAYNGSEFTISLVDGWELTSSPESVKAQGYNTLPTRRPVAGLFTLYKGTDLTFPASGFSYYVIHLDVQKSIPCL